MIEEPTRALRAGSPELLRDGLRRMLVAYGRDELRDVRDLLWSLAPYHDCAARLGLDPVRFFDEAAEEGPPGLRQIVTDFGRRTDTAPERFGGYALVDTPAGPAYVWT